MHRKTRHVTVAAAAALGLSILSWAGNQLGVTVPAVMAPAAAMTIEMEGDAGLGRVERQQRAKRGQLPLPGTPDLSRLNERLAEAGFAPNAPVYLRLFKETSILEVWMQKGTTFALFARYPICAWDGTYGPKLAEGDRQSPEGFFVFGESQLRWRGRYHRAFDLSFPTLFDDVNGRTGSAILIHGACSTVGCFAMTNPVIDELFELATRAMTGGQRRIAVHVFPFEMTEAALAKRANDQWIDYWRNLKVGYDIFERTHVPPEVSICNRRYWFEQGKAGYTGDRALGYKCGMWMAGGGEVEAARVAATPLPKHANPAALARAAQSRPVTVARSGPWRPSKRVIAFVSQQMAASAAGSNKDPAGAGGRAGAPVSDRVLAAGPSHPAAAPRLVAESRPRPTALPANTVRGFASSGCNPSLASCRKFTDLRLKRTGSASTRNRSGRTAAQRVAARQLVEAARRFAPATKSTARRQPEAKPARPKVSRQERKTEPKKKAAVAAPAAKAKTKKKS